MAQETRPAALLPQMLEMPEVMGVVKAARPTIYRWQRFEGFPKPYKFGRASRWNSQEVLAWIEGRGAARTA